MPHSQYLGRVVPQGGALWTDDDRAKVRAIMVDRAERCSQCGTYPSDMADENGRRLAFPKWRAVVHRCHVCEAAERALADAPSGEKGLTARIVANDVDEDEDDDDEDGWS